jgi:hypothetical protein
MTKDLVVQESGKEVIVGQSDDLSRVVVKALDKIEKILDMKAEGVDKTKILSIQKDAATAIINAGLKADENRFRRENKDIIERLYNKMKKDSKMLEGKPIK